MGKKACTLANGINNSTTKKRIIMMLEHKSNKYTWLKVLYVVPVVAGSLAVKAKTVTDFKIKPTELTITATTPTSAVSTITSEATEAKTLTFKVVFLPENSPIVGVPVEVIVNGKATQTTETAEKGLVKVNAPLGSTVRFTLIDRTKEVVVTKELLANSRVIAIGFEPKNEKKEAPDDESAIEDSEGTKVYDVVEDMPQFPGGQMELWEYLSKSLQYPEEAEKAGTQGRVIATFVVEKDGSITNARVVKALDSSLDAEALRVINAMPKWKPGKQNGVAVRCKYTVPVTFRLDGKEMP
jgi:TonB family protein